MVLSARLRFYDIGWVRQHATTWAGWQTVANQPNDYTLQGVGIGFTWSPVQWFQIKASVAHVIGMNAGRDASGNDADGTQDKIRGWVAGSLIF